MIKLEGNTESLTSLSKLHLEQLKNRKNGFVSPKENLREWIETGILTEDRRQFLRRIYDNFDQIIIAEVENLKSFIYEFGVVDQEFSLEIQKRFRYDAFRRSAKARNFIRKLNIKSCPYCNAQYIISLSAQGKLLCHFDHIFPKTKYPYLSLSFYNLIPCCGYCNQFKSNKDPTKDISFHNPFEKSLADKFKFKATPSAIVDFHVNGRTKIGVKNVELIPVGEIDIKFHRKTFKIEELHNEHHDVIDEVYLRSVIYNSSYFDELKQLYVEEQKLLTEEELKRVVYGNYVNFNDINKRPLAKLTQDLTEQFLQLRLTEKGS